MKLIESSVVANGIAIYMTIMCITFYLVCRRFDRVNWIGIIPNMFAAGLAVTWPVTIIVFVTIKVTSVLHKKSTKRV